LSDSLNEGGGAPKVDQPRKTPQIHHIDWFTQ
jgi:hypothetical protein